MCPESSARPRVSSADGHCAGPGQEAWAGLSMRGWPGCGLTPFSHPGWTAGVSMRARSDLQRRARVSPDPERRAPAGTASGRSVGAPPARDPETAALDPDSPVRVPGSVVASKRYRRTVGLNRSGIHRLWSAGFGGAGLWQSAGSRRIWNRHDVLPLAGPATARFAALTASASTQYPGAARPNHRGRTSPRSEASAHHSPRFEHATRGEFVGGDAVAVGQPKPVAVPNHSVPNMTKQAEELSDEQATFGRSRPCRCRAPREFREPAMSRPDFPTEQPGGYPDTGYPPAPPSSNFVPGDVYGRPVDPQAQTVALPADHAGPGAPDQGTVLPAPPSDPTGPPAVSAAPPR